MTRRIAQSAGVAAALAGTLLLPVPAADAAPAHRTSSACTHHLSGPQVCIRLVGRGTRQDHVIAVWANPPKGVNERTAHLYKGGGEPFVPVTGHRDGDEITADWGWMDLKPGAVCVGFDGTEGRRACQDVS
ncbi:hypothetical protein [Kitasatospora sp. GP82]|uniref:hypothetical protein n=1 Tax=Kitasatospora sp. GP82 TaxID=3035089 RepID=UPI0024748E2B|nr:hypothetical protein [Kitasatospora sp. GP82]MDH6130361.1 hypothetical protein [Kitasatospora sp. GP82]